MISGFTARIQRRSVAWSSSRLKAKGEMNEPVTKKVELNVTVRSSVSVSGVGFKAGLSKTKGWFQKFLTATNVLQADGTLANVTRYMKRKGFGNWYSEKVVDSVTGVVTNECEEPLDVHQRHGSDKPELKAARLPETTKR